MEKRSIRRRKLKKQRRRKIVKIISTTMFFLVFFLCIYYFNSVNDNSNKRVNVQKEEEEIFINKNEENIKQITISVAGDCTLGSDPSFSYSGSMIEEIDKYNKDYSQIMRNVRNVFSSDDYTIVNLEGTLTESNNRRNKGNGISYNFKAPKEYVNILRTASIEGVTISNNHIYDYGDEGIRDTLDTLNTREIEYCGESYKIIRNINEIKIGFLGYTGWYFSEEIKSRINNDINELKQEGVEVIIPYFHWGEENKTTPNDTQISIAHYAVDCGADIVIGSHSHVIQSLENYNGKLIAYSMGNFCFGGNNNPTDKDSFILQIRLTKQQNIVSKTEYRIIPVRISSVVEKNDYVPTIIENEEADNIIQRINNSFINFDKTIEDKKFFEIK